MNFKTEHKKLLAILILSLLLRMWGIEYGLPSAYNSDEVQMVYTAIGFGRGSLDPMFYAYPTAYMYLLFALYAAYFALLFVLGTISTPQEFLVHYLVDQTNFYLLARGLGAVAGTTTVALTYLIAKKLFNKEIALLSSLFLSVSSVHVEYAHYALPEATMLLLSMAAFYFIVEMQNSEKYRNYLLAGLFVGLATSTKYTAGPLIVSIFASEYIKSKKIGSFFSKKIILSVFSALAGFLIGSPHWLLSFEKYYAGARLLLDHAWMGSVGSARWLWVLEELVTKEHIFGVISIIATAYALKKRTKEDMMLLTPIIVYFLYIGSWATAVRQDIHYYILAIPLLCILSARFLHEAYKTKKYGVLPAIIIFATLITGLIASASYGYTYSKKDTRDTALEFIETNISPGSNIAILSQEYAPQFKTKQKISELNAKFKKYGLNINIDENIVCAGPQYNLTHIIAIESSPIWPAAWSNEEKEKYSESLLLQTLYKNRIRPLSELKALGVNYLIASSYDYEKVISGVVEQKNPRYFRDRELKEYYEHILYNSTDALELIKVFDNDRQPGPRIYIYKMK